MLYRSALVSTAGTQRLLDLFLQSLDHRVLFYLHESDYLTHLTLQHNHSLLCGRVLLLYLFIEPKLQFVDVHFLLLQCCEVQCLLYLQQSHILSSLTFIELS